VARLAEDQGNATCPSSKGLQRTHAPGLGAWGVLASHQFPCCALPREPDTLSARSFLNDSSILLAYCHADQRGEMSMAKILECAKVDPSSGCQHVVRGETEEEVLTKAAEHAKEHGIRDVTPELMERVKANIRDA
jgi:predicted small metal-binding protein